jgi:hypothetical protein
MQATTLTFVIVAAQIGTGSGQISQATSAALLAASLLSVTVFPPLAVKLRPTEDRAATGHRPACRQDHRFGGYGRPQGEPRGRGPGSPRRTGGQAVPGERLQGMITCRQAYAAC